MALTLPAELTAAQNSTDFTPYVAVRIGNRTYETGGEGDVKLLSVQDADGIYGAELLQLSAANGIPIPVAAIVTLLDPEGDLFSVDLRGQKVEVSWGYQSYRDPGGNLVPFNPVRSQTVPPYYVMLQRNTLDPQNPVVTLFCSSLWGTLSMPAYRGASAALVAATGTIKANVAAIMGGFRVGGAVSYTANSDDSKLNDTFEIDYPLDTPRLTLVQQLLDRTDSYLRLRRTVGGAAFSLEKYTALDGVVPATQRTIYDMLGVHGQRFFINSYDRATLLPSRILVTKNVERNDVARSDYDVDSQGVFDNDIDIGQIIEDPEIADNAEALAIAQRLESRYQETEFQGEITSLINVGQEPWDIVEIRLANSYFLNAVIRRARVNRIVRVFNARRREYHQVLTLGQVKSYPQLSSIELERIIDALEDFSLYRNLREKHGRSTV